MLKYLIYGTLGIWMVPAISQAQNIPNGATGPASATAKKLPANYSAAPTVNYVRSFSPQVPITDTSLINMSSTVESVITATGYADSYGRSVETISKQTSPNKKDNVSAATYDEFGRPIINYMPYTATSNDGAFKTNPFQQDSTFYKGLFSNEQIYYSQSLYDGSPMNIPVKSMAPGNSWGGAGVGVSYGHRSNTVADSVVLWTIAISTEDDMPVKSFFYAAGTLSVKEVTDERGIKAVQYTNEKGQTVLSKTQLASSPGTAHAGWLCTYYVYDETGHLRFTIPPKAVDVLNNGTNNWGFSTTPAINTDLCYAYYYDNRDRCIVKRIPGKGKTYIAYDLYNRVVMTQDPRLRTLGQWAFVLYDGQGRPNQSGLINVAIIKDSVWAQAARSLAYPTLSGTYTVTSESYYDDYSWVSGSGTSWSSSLDATNINGTNFFTSYNASPDFAQQITVSTRIRGAATGSRSIILGTSTYLYNLNLYDNKGRSIQSRQKNYSGGTDVATVQYDFAGRVLRSHLAHQKSGTNAQTHTVLTKYTYDHAGRIKTLAKNFDGLGDKTIAQTSYNESGQLQTNVIGSSIETQQFSYNIRGWINGINKDHVNNSTPSAFFGETISYDYGFTSTLLTGNKAGIKWRAAGDSNVRAYGYTYDNVNRLTAANFSQQNSGSSSWAKDKMDFSAGNLSYDANGNILSMSQRGLQVSTIALIDSLNYQYSSNSNRLAKVADLSTGGGFMGDFKDSTSTGDDYTYDDNGNIKSDNNRHMHTTAGGAGAVFNVLDKADSIVIAGKATTYYYYDAGGAMLGKKVNTYTPSGKVVKEYQYLGGFVYLNDTLQYSMIEGGRIRYAKKTNAITGAVYYAYEYDYFISDHMGNVRTVITEGRDTSTYKATMELANQTVEDALFANEYTPVNTIVNKSVVPAFDSDTLNQKIAKVNGSGNKIGPSLVLKVMAGDKVQLSTYAFFNTATQPPVGGINLLTDILNVLAGGVVNNSAGKLTTTNTSAVSTALSPNVTNFLDNNRSYDNAKPKAYLNWILFDNQFNLVATNSGVKQVEPGSSKQALVAPLQNIVKNGYLYVYVSNESPQDVYFDDITIKHTTGPLMQEQAYYPYGLQIQGLSDKALLKSSMNYKYNAGSELEDEDGIGYYNTFYRKYDAQIGRFTGIDILADKYPGITAYQFGNNNPAFFCDPSGAQGTTFGAVVEQLLNSDHGGSWHSGSGITEFGSDFETFSAGVGIMDKYNLWGQNNYASSLGGAKTAYYNLGGTEEEVSTVEHNITVYGNYKTGQWKTKSVNWGGFNGTGNFNIGNFGLFGQILPEFDMGKTATFIQANDYHRYFSGPWSGSLTEVQSAGVRTGHEGFITLNSVAMNGKIEGGDLSVGPVSFGMSFGNLSPTIGFSTGEGAEVHFSLPTSIADVFSNGLTIGSSYTSPEGIYMGRDITYKPGENVTNVATVGAAGALLVTQPELWPVTFPFVRQVFQKLAF